MEGNSQTSELGNHLKGKWQNFQLEKYFYDLTLACESKHIQTHKIVISSCSPILKEILKQTTNEQPLIHITGVKYEDLLNIVNFMYKGEVNILQNDLANFISLAKDLKVKGLPENMGNNIQVIRILGYNIEEPPEKGKDLIAKAININKKDTLVENQIDKKMDEVVLIESEKQQFLAKDLIDDEVSDQIIEIDNFPEHYPISNEWDVRNPLLIENKSQDRAIRRSVIFKENSKPALLKTSNDFESTYMLPIENDNIKYKPDNSSTYADGPDNSEKSAPKNVQIFCDKCSYKTSHVEHLQAHMKLIHQDVKGNSKVPLKLNQENTVKRNKLYYNQQFKCSQCYYETSNMDQLQVHIKSTQHNFSIKKTKEEATKSKFYCDKCKKIFDHMSSLKRHDKEVHKGIRHPCDQCDHTPFVDLRSLNSHMKAKHAGVSYPCNLCFPRSFSDPRSLKQHNDISHEGVRYPCMQCPSYPNFNILRELKEHAKRIHNT